MKPQATSAPEPEECPRRAEHVHVRRSWRSVAPHILLALAVTVAVIGVSMATGIYGVVVDLPDGKFTLPLAPLILAVFLARPFFLMKDSHHELRCTELRSISGRLSRQRVRVDIPYEDILGVRVAQTILQRFLNVGDILAWTASAARPEITMAGIGNPNYHSTLLAERLRNAQHKSSPQEGGAAAHGHRGQDSAH